MNTWWPTAASLMTLLRNKRLLSMYNSGIRLEIADVKCHELFEEYRRSLTF